MRTCNHTEYLFRFWGKYLLDQSRLKKTRTHHQQNSENVKEHEKFPLELFPTCCINKGRVCWSFPPTPFIFWERSMLSLRDEACFCQSLPPLLSWDLVCGFPTPPLFLYPPAFSSVLLLLKQLHKGFPAESSWCPVLAAFPRLGVGEGLGGWLSQEINGCLFSPSPVVFCVDEHGPNHTDPFCRAISIQMCLFTNSGN